MLLIYGANGYTGRLIAAECVRRHLPVTLAGRRDDAIRSLAARFGLPWRTFPLDHAEQVAASLEGVKAVIHAAGPFYLTSAVMVEACLRRGVHYLDITGEIAVFEKCLHRHEEASRAGIVVLPGAGFDVVPSDCLAASLASRFPGGDLLQLAFASTGGLSPGTARTVLAGLSLGGAVRREGRITRVPMAWKEMKVPFHDRSRTAVSISWGDVSTAYVSTGIRNIETYAALPARTRRWLPALRAIAPLTAVAPVHALLDRIIRAKVRGPDETARHAGRSELWARITRPDGSTAEATLTTPEGYRLTAMSAVECAYRVLHSPPPPGYHTPATAFGADFITQLPECVLRLPT
jgi:saccharopine dehydrogenase (NAD+, L-lysine-forming)